MSNMEAEHLQTYVQALLSKRKAINSAKSRRYREANKECIRIKRRAYIDEQLADPERRKQRNIKKRWYRKKWLYDLTETTWHAMFAAQGFACAICGNKAPKGDWQTDHCHQTDIVRSILCTSCNTLVGRIEKNPEQHNKCIEYVKRHQCQI